MIGTTGARVFLVMVAAGIVALLGIVVFDPVSADEPAITATPTAEARIEGTDPFPITDTMTETVQMVLDAYLAANAASPFGTAPGPVEIAQIRPAAALPVVVRPRLIPTAFPTATARPTATPQPDRDDSDVAVTLWPEPSIRAARGGLVTYTVRIANYGTQTAERTVVTLPFQERHLSLVTAGLDASRGDWVSAVSNTRVELSFGPLAGGAKRAGTLTFRVNGTLATDTILDMRAGFSWSDRTTNHTGIGSNWAPVLVGSGNDSAPYVWLKIDPTSGIPATTYQVISNRYLPGEGVLTWLNTPIGVKPFEARAIADGRGNIILTFSSIGLPRGIYQLVAYGTRSELTGVITFTVI